MPHPASTHARHGGKESRQERPPRLASLHQSCLHEARPQSAAERLLQQWGSRKAEPAMAHQSTHTAHGQEAAARAASAPAEAAVAHWPAVHLLQPGIHIRRQPQLLGSS